MLDWDEIYAGQPRWDIGRPQPAFRALAESGAIAGRVLDVGCGTGEHVLMCAALGLDATGVDLAGAAIAAAERKAAERGLTARFLRHDVRRLAELERAYDTVLDCGLLVHLLGDERDRTAYLDGLAAVVEPGGRYFVLCLREPPGPPLVRHLSRDDVLACFTEGWRVDEVAATTLDSRTDPDGLPGWLVALTRTPAMVRLRARIETDQGERYLTQLCRHASAIGGRLHSQVTAEWSGGRGTVTFASVGRCTLTADAGALTVDLEAVDQPGAARIRDLVTRDLERFGHRAALVVSWHEA